MWYILNNKKLQITCSNTKFRDIDRSSMFNVKNNPGISTTFMTKTKLWWKTERNIEDKNRLKIS